jgi:hypothetical protein
VPFPCLAKEARHGAPGPPQGLKPAFILTLYAALKRRSSTVVWAVGTIRGIWERRRDQSQNQRQGRQECPFRTGNVNPKAKANAARVRDSHLSQQMRKMGHPCLVRVRSRSKSRSTAAGGFARSTPAFRAGVSAVPNGTWFLFLLLTQDLRPGLLSAAPPGLGAV